MALTSIRLTVEHGVAAVELSRPEKANAFDLSMWHQLREVMRTVDDDPAARVAVLTGAGKHFCAGIDLGMLGSLLGEIDAPDEGRRREKLRRLILDLQDTLTSIERCRKPVIAAIHGACVGGGIDLVTACDFRYATADARLSVKEIDVGMVADVGTLQRLPRLVGDGRARELAYTGRTFDGAEALRLGLVERTFGTREEMVAAARETAGLIAAKPPLAIRGIKAQLLWARDHTVAEGLDYVATWNAAMLLSSDLTESAAAAGEKRTPKFDD